MELFIKRFTTFVLVIALAGCAHKKAPSPQPTDNEPHLTVVPKPLERAPYSPLVIPTVNIKDLRQQVHALEAQLEMVLQSEGTQALSRYLRLRARQGLKISALRDLFYHKDGLKPDVISTEIPSDGQDMIKFANQQLRESGIDFIQFKGVINKRLPRLERPLPSQTELYRRWEVARTTSMPLIGFAITVLEAGANVSSAEIIASIVRAFTVLALDLQFRIFKSFWTKLQSNNAPLLARQIGITTGKFHRLIEVMNELLRSARGATKGYLDSYLIDWGYALLLYASQSLTLHYIIPGYQEFSILKMINKSWLVNTAYFVAFGLLHNALKTSEDRGEISETLRYQIESVGAAWASFWRLVSLIPKMNVISQVMLYSFGAIVTVPFLVKTWSATDYANETAHIFASHEGEEVPITRMSELLGDSYDYPHLSRQMTFSNLFAKLRGQLMSDLEQR